MDCSAVDDRACVGCVCRSQGDIRTLISWH
jgi:hypothetical protein